MRGLRRALQRGPRMGNYEDEGEDMKRRAFVGRTRAACIVAAVALLALVFGPTAGATSPLTASKTAEARWTKTFTWTIDKSVDPASHDLLTGESGTSTYTIAVTKSAGTTSPVTVSGEVCVANNGPVATENLTITDRVAALLPGGTLSLAIGPVDTSANPVLDPGESHCYPYSFVITPRADAVGYRNDAQIKITNDPRDPGQPLGPSVSASFTVPATPTLINDSINVDDTNGMSWPFSSSGSVSYTKTFTCDEDEGQHVNTATIRETGQSDDASVTVTCTPPPPDGCTYTIGYWKTHSKYGPAPYDSTWALVGEDTTFFLSGKTWYQAFSTAPAGNAYDILAHQYMGAVLNKLNGADTSSVDATLATATTLFNTYTPAQIAALSGGNAVRKQFVALAEILDNYTTGRIGPGHC
jgi:hypothetical protein